MNEASDDELDESMDSFEAALTAQRIALPRITPHPICLALDGSNQDAAANGLAEALAAHLAVAIHRITPSGEGLAFQNIVDHCRTENCGLIVVPAPFREDFDELGTASIGTNLDMLLHRRETPLLVVRDPDRSAAEVLEEVVLPLHFVAHDDARAVAWAFYALAPHGRLHLLAVADTGTLGKTSQMIADALELKDIDHSVLAGLGQPEMAGLVAAAQRHAAEVNVGCRLSIRVGPPAETVAQFANELACVLLTTCPRDEHAPAYSRAHSLIRQSHNPVLVIGS